MTDQKKIQHTANSLNAMIDRICARNGWTRDETLTPKSKISVTVKVAMPKPISQESNAPEDVVSDSVGHNATHGKDGLVKLIKEKVKK